jgi:modulator of FtsH protease HflC
MVSKKDYNDELEREEQKSIERQKRIKKKIRGVAAKILIGGAALVTALGSFYTIDQTEQAVITQFGKPVRVVLNPLETQDREETVARLKKEYAERGVSVSEGAGLRFKIPFIQSVNRFDRRLQRWNGNPEQIPTKDKKYIWVDTTARFYIEDPLKFLNTVGNEYGAHGKLDEVVDSEAGTAIRNRNLIEIVRTDERKMRIAEEELRETIPAEDVKEGRGKILGEITLKSRAICRDRYGIGIHQEGVLIKGLNYVQEVKEKVEDRMIAERLRIAEKYTSEGEGEYQRIMGDKERDVKGISSEAEKTAKEIMGRADAEATGIYARGFHHKEVDSQGKVIREYDVVGFNSDPDFYKFWRTLQLYEDGVGKGTRMVIGTDNPLFGLMKGNIGPYEKRELKQIAPVTNPAEKR